MKIALLLDKLRSIPDIRVEEHILPDGTRNYLFSAAYPFPRRPGPAWYPIPVKSEQDEIKDGEIEAMLRHLWMFNLDILPGKREK